MPDISSATTYFSIFPSLPREFLSKKAYKLTHSVQISDSVNFVKNDLVSGIAPANPLAVLLSLSEKIQDPAFRTGNLDSLRKALPLLLDSTAFVNSSWRTFDSCHSILKKTDEHMIVQCYITSVLNRISAKLNRSERNIELPAGITEDQLVANVLDQVQICYDRFFNELTYVSYQPSARPVCRKTLVKTILQDYWIYPVLPALFALDAIYQVTQNEKRSKSELLTPNTDFPSLETNVYCSQIFYRECLRLIKALTKTLSYVLEPIYTPIPLPKPSKKRGSFSSEVNPYSFHSEQANKKKESEQDYFTLQKDFVLPICRTDQLAVDLASSCALTIEQALDLSKSLPAYLIDAQYGEDAVKTKYNDTVREIIKVFRSLARPETYYTGTSFTQTLIQATSSISASAREFFRIESNNEQPSFEQIQIFANKYFSYVELSKDLLFRSIPILPLRGNESLFPKYYNGLLDTFRDHGDDKYIQPDALNQHLGFSMKSLQSSTTSTLRRSLRQNLLQNATVNDAILFLKNHLQNPPKNPKSLNNCVISYMKSHDLWDINYGSLHFSNEQYLKMYQFLLKHSIDVLGHYAVIVLLKCNLSSDTSEKISENMPQTL